MTDTGGRATDPRYDAFISYARDDREAIVRPLYEHLTDMGLRVWFDEREMRVGDPVLGSISEGMRRSDHGIVVLSEGFLDRKYTMWELQGFLNHQLRKDHRRKVLLPLYYGVDEETVGEYSYSLANLHALTVTEENVETVAERLYEVITGDRPGSLATPLDGGTTGDDAVTRPRDDGHAPDPEGEHEGAREFYERGLELAEDIENQRNVAESLDNLGHVAQHVGRYDEAREHYERSLERYRELGDPERVITLLYDLGEAAHEQGETADARGYVERGLEAARELGYQDRVAEGHRYLGHVATDPDEAREHYERSLERYRELGDEWMVGTVLDNLGGLEQDAGRYGAARDAYERSLELRRKHGDRQGVARCLNRLGNIAYSQGENEVAAGYHERSLERYRELDDSVMIATVLNNLGHDAYHLNEYDDARDYYERSLRLHEELGKEAEVATLLDDLGNTARAQGDYESARDYYERGLELREEFGDGTGSRPI